MITLSILVPVYNEEECIELFYNEVIRVIKNIGCKYEILFVNDGSKDNTLLLIKQLIAKDNCVRCVDLARNYGKEIAMAAGMDNVKGDAVVILDVDLQDPPEVICEMYKWLYLGYDDIFAVREKRIGETYIKKITSKIFYRLLAFVSDVEVQVDAGDFRMLSKKAIDAFKEYRDKERYTKGIFCMIGLRKKKIVYERQPRIAGNTKWNYFKLFGLAINGITSFTIKPLRISSLMGIIISLLALMYILIILFKTIAYGDPVAGYPSLVSIVLFIGGIQLITIGIIGEYLGRIFYEVKRRPIYQLNEFYNEK